MFMTLKYERNYLNNEISDYLLMSNDPYKGSILWQGYLFGLVAGGMLEIEDYNDLIKTLPFTVQITNTF